MKTKILAPLAAILLCAFAHAETKTWTGNAGTFDYATADNWNPAGIPAETDDVIIDGAAVTYNGSGRILSYGDYGDLTDVYEYIGTDDDLANPANWAKDKSAPTPAAPVAGTDIRWFGRNADYSGRLSITDRDRFDGATLRLTDDQWDAFFDVSVSGTSVAETGATPYNLTLAYWEPFPARTVRNWTIQTGARVKLDRTFPSAA